MTNKIEVISEQIIKHQDEAIKLLKERVKYLEDTIYELKKFKEHKKIEEEK